MVIHCIFFNLETDHKSVGIISYFRSSQLTVTQKFVGVMSYDESIFDSAFDYLKLQSPIMGGDNSTCCSTNSTNETSNSQKRRRIGRLGDKVADSRDDDEVSVTGSDVSRSSLSHLQHTETQRGFAQTEFKQAIEEGNEEKAMQIMEEYADLDMLEVTFDDGGNCLHEAVQFKEYKIIVFLLENGVSV